MPRKSPYACKDTHLSESLKLRLRQQNLALRRDLFRFEAEMNRQHRARMNEILRKHGQDELTG